MNFLYESKRIGFSNFSESFYEDFVNMYIDKNIQRKIFKKEFSREQITNWFFKIIKESKNNFMMLAKNDNKFLGNIEVIIKDNVAEITICITPNFQNMHYGNEAIKATIDYFKKNKNISNFELYVYKNNSNAIHCYENIGFIIDGEGISSNDVHMKLK